MCIITKNNIFQNGSKNRVVGPRRASIGIAVVTRLIYNYYCNKPAAVHVNYTYTCGHAARGIILISHRYYDNIYYILCKRNSDNYRINNRILF